MIFTCSISKRRKVFQGIACDIMVRHLVCQGDLGWAHRHVCFPRACWILWRICVGLGGFQAIMTASFHLPPYTANTECNRFNLFSWMGLFSCQYPTATPRWPSQVVKTTRIISWFFLIVTTTVFKTACSSFTTTPNPQFAYRQNCFPNLFRYYLLPLWHWWPFCL